MNELLFVASLATLLGALPLIFVGFQIVVNDKTHWISGIDKTKLTDPVRFAKYIGNSVAITGVLTFLASMLLYIQVIDYIGFTVALMLCSLLPLFSFLKAKKLYTRQK